MPFPRQPVLVRIPILSITLAVLGAFILLASVSEGASELDGTWRLASVGGSKVNGDPRQVPYFTIRGSEISGYDGCNRFSGHVDEPERILKTERACAGKVIELPLDLGNIGRDLGTAVRSGRILRLPRRGQLPESVFIRE
jgi:heat shock protein HslJ